MERKHRGVGVAEWRPMGQRTHRLNHQEPWIGRTNGVAIGRAWRVRAFWARKRAVSLTQLTLGGSEASHQRVSRYPPIAYKKRIWGLFQHRTGGSNGKVRAGPNWSESQTVDTEQTVNSLNTTPIPLHYIYRGLQDLSRLCSAVLVSTKEH